MQKVQANLVTEKQVYVRPQLTNMGQVEQATRDILDCSNVVDK
ncbi:MAG TPA: hypothetical protein VHD56_07855 [Tepidisphaeraceae bacterium]|nr:hypothetical protein [Tepidisphaeraceae bacterium]